MPTLKPVHPLKEKGPLKYPPHLTTHSLATVDKLEMDHYDPYNMILIIVHTMIFIDLFCGFFLNGC